MSRRLTEAEERALFAESRSRIDERIRRAARNAIIEGHLWLVALMSRDYRCSDEDRADLRGEGHVALFIAFDRFDPARGVRFATYARYWVHALMSAHLERARSRAASLDAPTDDGDTLHDHIAAESDDLDARLFDAAIARAVTRLMPTLDPRERTIYEARFDDALDLDAVASQLDLSRERVRQLEARLRAKLARGLRPVLGERL